MSGTVEQARQAILDRIEARDFRNAAATARQYLLEFDDDPRLVMLLGLALVEDGQVDEGAAALKRSTELEPTNPEAFHNLAVALCNLGDFAEAETYAKEAIRLDPHDKAAQDVLNRCEKGLLSGPFEAAGELIPAEKGSARLGADDAPAHVLNLGEAWTRIGFGLVAYCVLGFTFMIFHPFWGQNGLVKNTYGMASFFLYITSWLGTVTWTLIDIIDRRERFVWLLPMWVCGLTALPVLPLCLYLALRKQMPQVS